MHKRKRKRDPSSGKGGALQPGTPADAPGLPPPLPEKLPLEGRMTMPLRDPTNPPAPKPEVEFELHEDVERAMAAEVEAEDRPVTPSAVPPPLPASPRLEDLDELEDRVTVPAPRADQPAEVRIDLLDLPADAWVELDGVPVDPPLLVPRSTGVLKLEIRASGYLPYEDRIVPDRDLELRPALMEDGDD